MEDVKLVNDLAHSFKTPAEIEAQQTLVVANRELIIRFEQMIQATLAPLWGEEPACPGAAKE